MTEVRSICPVLVVSVELILMVGTVLQVFLTALVNMSLPDIVEAKYGPEYTFLL